MLLYSEGWEIRLITQCSLSLLHDGDQEFYTYNPPCGLPSLQHGGLMLQACFQYFRKEVEEALLV